MKNKNLKSFIRMVLMVFIAFTSNETFAQKDQHRNKNKKQKVETPVKHYAKQPRRGAQVTQLPRRTVVVSHRNSNYHYRDGIFYRPIQGSYIVAAPPIGIRVQNLPANPISIRISGFDYYYYYGIYYAPLARGGYEVVNPPLGAIVDALPDGYDVFELEGMVYYRLDETYYKALLDNRGNVVYEVVRV